MRKGRKKMSEVINVEEIFASKVFTRATMKERLPKNGLPPGHFFRQAS